MRIWHAARLRPRQLLALLLTTQLLTPSSLLGLASAREARPSIAQTSFANPLHGVFYFHDSETVLAYDRERGILYRSTDAGAHWTAVKDIPEGKVRDLWQHPYDRKLAYVLSEGHTHWRTKNQGESWSEFETAASPSAWAPTLTFHADDSDKIIFHGDACKNVFECTEVALYTKDGFATSPSILRMNVVSCTWARSSEFLRTGHEFSDKDRTLCIVKGRYSPWPKDYRLLLSDNYFLEETEPELASGRTVQGLVNMATVKKFMVAATKAERTDEMALYVTDDTNTWHRAEFSTDHRLEEDAYTILESTNYSIQVDVLSTKPSASMGSLFTSNSNGTYFSRNIEHTNRNQYGYVDYEKVKGIQGIVLVNTVDNWKEVQEGGLVRKKLQSKISFDDSRTFQGLKAGKEDLHLHSVSSPHNPGRVFSSPAPGIVMGNGNTGPHLDAYKDANLFVSDDAGLTWRKSRDKPHKYETGDQGSVLVAIADQEWTDEIAYSINHGRDWTEISLGEQFHADRLTTSPDSTSLKFMVIGSKKKHKSEHVIVALDFQGLHERKCGEKDFEKWWARLDAKGEPDCLMGQKQYYQRRKADADCFIDEEFKDPQPQFEQCVCTDEDFECDYNFVKTGETCVAAGPIAVPNEACKNAEGTFMGSSGYTLIPGNQCRRDGGVQKDKAIERKCKDSVKPPVSGKISHGSTEFKAHKFRELFYLERTESSTGDDESILMRTDEQKIYITHDHGKSWQERLEGEEITAIYPHPHFNDVVYFLTNGRKVFYTINRGKKMHSFRAPAEANRERLPELSFHPKKKDWLIWTGAQDCEKSKADCHSVAYISTDRGDNWSTLLRWVQKCQFISDQGRKSSDKLIFCAQYTEEDHESHRQLISSDDFFVDARQIHYTDVIRFATMSEFIVAATKAENGEDLRVSTSVDGKTFANALFPANFNVPHQRAYTLLDSSTHAVFLHVTVQNTKEHEYGSILKSNSNGTSYVLSLSGANRNRLGYVDYEKLHGIEGVAMANVVGNVDAVDKGEAKKVKSMITHNDGAEWALLPAPSKDADGKAIDCGAPCSLHVHGYTERANAGDRYSSPFAVGLTIATGNVGEYLGAKKDADTFLSRDAGISWQVAQKGRYLWKFGDQGAIVVLVAEGAATDTMYYSLNEGQTWDAYAFSETKVVVSELATVPSGTSRNFLVLGQREGLRQQVVTINVDFSQLRSRPCTLDEKDPEAGDYYLWTPKHPLQENDCLFGHVAQYHRKRPEADCYNGRSIERLHAVQRNCSCTRRDFECDYNYERQNDGSCGLVPGRSPQDHRQICADDPSAHTWYEPTGYRRIPLTTCRGGRELEFLESKAHPCPNHEADFEKAHARRLSSAALFFAIVLPLALAAAAGYWVWRHWDGKFGRIRLGADGGAGPGAGRMVWDAERAWIKYPVMAVAVVAAVVVALPDTLARVWGAVASRLGLSRRPRFGWGGRFGGARAGAGAGAAGARTGAGAGAGAGSDRRYTTRRSFARGRGEYDAVVNTDEGELLGDDDSDEEVAAAV